MSHMSKKPKVRVGVRLSASDVRRIEKAARAAGLETLSAWIRKVCLDRLAAVERGDDAATARKSA
jgi:predicted DNA binding CopG/RHH family protein